MPGYICTCTVWQQGCSDVVIQQSGVTTCRAGGRSEGMAGLAAAVVAACQLSPTSSTTTERGCLTTGEGPPGVAPQASRGHWGLTWRAVCKIALLAHRRRHLLCNLQTAW